MPSQGRTAVYAAAENRQHKGLKKQAAILYFAAAHLLPAMPGVQRNAQAFLQKEAPDLASKLQASGPVMTRSEVRRLLMEQEAAA